MLLPVDYDIVAMQPVTIELCNQARDIFCRCGKAKETARPFCHACMQFLVGYKFDHELHGAWSEYRHADSIRIQGFMFCYDLCCDALDAIATGRLVHQRKKKGAEYA